MYLQMQTELAKHPKLRRLAKAIQCSNHEAIGVLFSLWSWGLINAEQSGILPYTERSDIERCLLGDAGNSSRNMEVVVDCLIKTGWVDEDENGELKIHDWDIWQGDWYKAKERRHRDNERKREQRRQRENDARKEEAQESIPGFGTEAPAKESPEVPAGEKEGQQSETPKKPKEGGAGKKSIPKSYGLAFEQFWEEYPRKDDKAYAYQKYMARLKDGWSEDELLRAAKNYAYVCKKKGTERDYIKQAKTFLSESTPFTDFLPKKPRINPQVPNTENPFSEYKDE